MLTATRQLAASVLALTIALPAAAAPKTRAPKKPAPVAKPAPAAKPESAAQPAPDSGPAPDLKPAPDLMKPEAAAKPAEAKAAEAKPEPEAKPAPQTKPEAEAKPAPQPKPEAEAKPARSALPAGVLDAPTRAPEPFIHGHRYAYVAGGVLLLGGVGFGYFSRGEAKRAESLEKARDAQAALSRARTAAATSNLLYGVAGLTIAYGLLLEVLPEPAADAASLTYHF
jgi:outer membrane biosynthesis protein TonB